MAAPLETLDPVERDICHAVTLWVVTLHTCVHLASIFILSTASIRGPFSTLSVDRLSTWTAPECFLIVSVVSLMGVVSTVAMGTLARERCYPRLVAFFQVALAAGTCIYAMILCHLFPFMAFGQ